MMIFNKKNTQMTNMYQFISCNNTIQHLVDKVVACIIKYFDIEHLNKDKIIPIDTKQHDIDKLEQKIHNEYSTINNYI